MGYNVLIRIRGYTDWIQYGHALTRPETKNLIRDLSDRIQILTLPDGEDLQDVEDSIEDGETILYEEITEDVEEKNYDTYFGVGFEKDE